MKCPKCQTANPGDSKYCKECSALLTIVKDISFTWTLKAPAVGFSKGAVIAEKYKIIEEIGRGISFIGRSGIFPSTMRSCGWCFR